MCETPVQYKFIYDLVRKYYFQNIFEKEEIDQKEQQVDDEFEKSNERL